MSRHVFVHNVISDRVGRVLANMDNILCSNGLYGETDLIKYYYGRSPRLKREEICFIMTEHHKIPVTLERLKTSLSKLGLNRKGIIDDALLDGVVRNEVSTSRSLIGYRQMKHVICRKYDINVSYERVRKSLLRIDPEGVALRFPTNACYKFLIF